MIRIYHYSILAILILFTPAVLHGFIAEESITLSPGQTEYQLSYPNIILNTDIVQSEEGVLLAGIDYRILPSPGKLILLKPLLSPTLSISYMYLPPDISVQASIYQRQALSDSLVTLDKKPRNLWYRGNSNLVINGSKTFAISFSEQGDTDLLQSLYVNLSGELAKDISISAQLSDSQSKLSPEGDSKELSSLDNVFVRVYSKRWSIGMGDLDLEYSGSRYMNYKTRLEGILATYEGNLYTLGAFSAGGGKSATTTINIIDGKQGPYYLLATSTQRSFIVVAGTEEIFVNGKRLERGTDYYIDYAEGSIMFRFLIRSSDIVNAYFQYTDEFYRQSTIFSASKIPISHHLNISHHFIHQTDAKNTPLLYAFTVSDLDSLSLAGDNAVFADGVMPVDVGTGSYKRMLSDTGEIYYEYAENDTLAIYSIVFSFVGANMGSYTEYSTGKYRWVGNGNGAYLPIKRIIPPSSRSNLELGIQYGGDSWQSGINGMYSADDKNTFSSRDDNDNQGAYLSAYLHRQNPEDKFILKLDGEYRWRNTFRFSSDGIPEYDLAALPKSDSLAMATTDLSLAYAGKIWKPSLLLRWRNLDEKYQQNALRIVNENSAVGIVPSTLLQATISEQTKGEESLLEHYNADLLWKYKAASMKLSGLISRMVYADALNLDSEFTKFSPTLGWNGKQQITALAYVHENSKIRQTTWRSTGSSETYSIRHSSSYPKHRLDLDFSHRNLSNPNSVDNTESSYELLTLRSNHNLLKNMISINNNYQLNQTEFFPRIRDLIYVGQGLGMYDSTGVQIDTGDYIYEYITSPTGSLTTEITAISSWYIKPGLYLKHPFWQRIQGDFSFNGIEQRQGINDWQAYLFVPEYTFSEDSSVYGKQSFLQNAAWDAIHNRMILNLSNDITRILDKRYQDAQRNFERRSSLQLNLKGKVNSRWEVGNEYITDSRYESEVNTIELLCNLEKNFSTRSSTNLDIRYSQERGAKQDDSSENYQIKSFTLAPMVKSVLLQKYRLSSRINLGYNIRNGSAFLSFLPQKREGFFSDGNVSAIYKINGYSSFTLDYRYTKYPQTKSTHNLKLEFKAEL